VGKTNRHPTRRRRRRQILFIYFQNFKISKKSPHPGLRRRRRFFFVWPCTIYKKLKQIAKKMEKQRPYLTLPLPSLTFF